PQLKEYETDVLTAQETLATIEADVFRRIVAAVADRSAALLRIATCIAEIDVLSTFAEVAAPNNYVRPTVDESRVIEIIEGRHPTLEMLLGPGEYVPNDAMLDAESGQITILTGPNMAGKSSWLRQVSLIVLLAQIGAFVPARQARIGLVDRIFTRIGAQDDIASGQSTFMVEMLETASILNHATPRSLLVLDEIGRGTSTYDGLAIAQAIVEHLHNAPNLGCRTLFATHYHELTELEEILPRVRCSKMDVLEDGDRVVFLRKVVPGGADRSYGIHVAQIAGIPKAVVRRAQEILDGLEQDAPGEPRLSRASREAENRDTMQLTLFGETDPVVAELRTLDVSAMSPLEAITALFTLQAKARKPE
ncbi:MAG: MutS-related protein, partial [Chloroflexota bacterium]